MFNMQYIKNTKVKLILTTFINCHHLFYFINGNTLLGDNCYFLLQLKAVFVVIFGVVSYPQGQFSSEIQQGLQYQLMLGCNPQLICSIKNVEKKNYHFVHL